VNHIEESMPLFWKADMGISEIKLNSMFRVLGELIRRDVETNEFEILTSLARKFGGDFFEPDTKN
jgi:hypothetical protein